MYRQLGTEERLFWSYAQLRPVHFTLTANIIGSLHLEGLRQALAKVQHRHPSLNVKIALDRTEIPWFITDSVQIPVRVVERHTPQQWQQEVERELANPFDWSQAPLIRVVLYFLVWFIQNQIFHPPKSNNFNKQRCNFSTN